MGVHFSRGSNSFSTLFCSLWGWPPPCMMATTKKKAALDTNHLFSAGKSAHCWGNCHGFFCQLDCTGGRQVGTMWVGDFLFHVSAIPSSSADLKRGMRMDTKPISTAPHEAGSQMTMIGQMTVSGCVLQRHARFIFRYNSPCLFLYLLSCPVAQIRRGVLCYCVSLSILLFVAEIFLEPQELLQQFLVYLFAYIRLDLFN